MGEPDEESVPAEVSEVYRAAQVVGETERVRARPDWFHGDGREGDVDVVAVDRELGIDREAPSDEEIVEFGLSLAAQARAACSDGVGPSWEAAASLSLGKSLRSTRGVRGMGQAPALVRLGSRHAYEHGGAATATFDPTLGEPTSDHGPADAEAFRDSFFALALEVALDEVVYVERDPSWAGWVFNFDTGHGFYLIGSGGLLCANCRCGLAYAETPQGALNE
jgi:hypothetical protein